MFLSGGWLCTIFLFWLFTSSMVVSNEMETNVTARMKHIVQTFVSDSNNKHPMADVLAFVHSNYNVPIDQVKMYYKMWRGIFPRMIIFGEWSHESVHEMHQQYGLPVFKCPQTARGHLAQAILLRGLEHFQHASFKGYVYIHDDLLISPAKIVTLDKTKLWIGNGMGRTVLEPWNSRRFTWYWHNNQLRGIPAVQKVYDKYPEVERIVANCTDAITGQKGSAHTLYNGHSDFFYIPKAYVPSYQQYMGYFTEMGVFLETAVATWAKCFTPNFDTTAEQLELCTTWDYSIRGNIVEWGHNCPANTTIIHPVKYSNPSGLKFAQDWLLKNRNEYSSFTVLRYR